MRSLYTTFPIADPGITQPKRPESAHVPASYRTRQVKHSFAVFVTASFLWAGLRILMEFKIYSLDPK